MATRSAIAIFDKEKNIIKSIYCHYDGYLEGVGEILKENYNNLEIINKLIELGDIPFLAKHLEELEPYNDVEAGQLKYKVFDSIDNYTNYLIDSPLDFGYLYKDDKWFYLEIDEIVEFDIYNPLESVNEGIEWKIL
jgi:hypothetical protein